MTHYTKEVEGMMNKFLDAEIKWVDIDNGLGKYMLASQVIEQAHKVFTEYQESLHHQLQKARYDWLREEIVKLEGMKVENEHNSECLHNKVPEYCDCDNYIKWNQALQTIIDYYQAELNQDNK